VDVCFSNRPLRVKRYQTVHCYGVDVAHGLVLLFGIGTWALPSWDSRMRRNNLSGGLAINCWQVQADIRSHLIRRPARDIIPTARWNSRVLLLPLILDRSHAATASRVQRNSVPSIQMRCMITASRRARATMAFFSPRCLAIFIAQALSQDHLVERTNKIWAAS
jgi:hypothetical protein